jgi:hypothetical protein
MHGQLTIQLLLLLVAWLWSRMVKRRDTRQHLGTVTPTSNNKEAVRALALTGLQVQCLSGLPRLLGGRITKEDQLHPISQSELSEELIDACLHIVDAQCHCTRNLRIRESRDNNVHEFALGERQLVYKHLSICTCKCDQPSLNAIGWPALLLQLIDEFLGLGSR